MTDTKNQELYRKEVENVLKRYARFEITAEDAWTLARLLGYTLDSERVELGQVTLIARRILDDLEIRVNII